MNKQQLRKLYLKKRMELAPAKYVALNLQLLEQFNTLNLTNLNCIHLFLPILDRREPDAFMLIEWLKLNHPEIKRVYPKANFADSTMTHFYDDAELKLASNAFGIPEPVAGNKVNVNEINMVMVPLLAVDKAGYRVGYGKGFYDRFMAQCNPDTQFTGLSFFDPVDTIDDIDQFDIPLHRCITPGKIWGFDHSVPL